MAVAIAIAERLRSLQLPHARSRVDDYLTLSFGIACVVPRSGWGFEVLKKEAKRVLYQAKVRGRDRVAISGMLELPSPPENPIPKLLMSASKLSEITLERQPSQDRLEQLGISRWPIWSKEISEFPWTYDDTETCYFLEGEVIVTPQMENL